VQIPSWNTALIDLALAAESQAYCDEITGLLSSHGLAISEPSQMVAVHPAYDLCFEASAPEPVRGNPHLEQQLQLVQ
jgi:hypothetical protein